jgi:prophage maintenance system killer protein
VNTGFQPRNVFLRLNGWKILAKAKEAHAFLVGLLEEEKCDLKHLLPWIRRSMVKL